MHRLHKNIDGWKSAQTEQWQNRSSSLSLFVFLETLHCFPPWFDYSWLSQHPHLWFCQEPWIHSWLKTVNEEAHHKNLKLLTALDQSTGFSLKTQPRLLFLPISSHGLTTATISSWVHLILSSNLSRKFKTLLQDSYKTRCCKTHHHHSAPLLEKLHWHISEHVKCKVAHMCFSAINGSGPACLSELLHVYTLSHTLRSSSDTRMLKIKQYKRKTHGFHTFSCFGPHIWNSLPQDFRHCSTLSSFKAKLKTFLFSQYFLPG